MAALDAFRDQANQFYTDTFGRAGDDEGVKFWADQLASGKSADQVKSDFLGSARVTEDNFLKTGQSQYADLLNQDLKDGAKAGTFNSVDMRTNAEMGLDGDVFTKLYGGKPQTKPTSGVGGAPQLPTGAFKDATHWNVAPNQTVAQQLTDLVNTDSPYMQRARTRAMQTANASGLSNTSMAATAGEAAAIDAALPIAQQDASTFANAGQFNAGADNTFGRDANQRNWDATMANFNVGANEWAKEQDFGRDLQLKNLDSGTQQATLQRGYINAINQARADFNDKVANISASNTMDSSLKKETIQNLRASYNTMIGNFAKLLGWDENSWLIQADDANGAGSGTGSAGTTQAKAADGTPLPQAVGGKAVDWSAPAPNGLTYKQQYDSYKAAGGTLSPDDWYRVFYGAGSGGWQNGGGDADGSAVGGTAGGGIGSNANGDAAGVGAGPM
jgi:hypothetical protein